MKVLVLAPHPFFQSRGTPIAVRALVQALAGAGYRVDVLTYHEGEEVQIPGGQVHRIVRIPGLGNIRAGFSWKKLVCDGLLAFKALALTSRTSYDLIHAVEESAFIALFLKWWRGTPYLYDMDSSLARQMVERFSWLKVLSGLLEFCEQSAIRGSLGVVAVCRLLEEQVLNVAPDKLVLRLEDFSLLPPEGGGEGRQAVTLDIARPRALYVGNLEPYQGIDLLLESFRILKDAGEPGSLAVIGGREVDIARYRKKVRAAGLEERVHLLGPRPLRLLGSYLAEADVLVSPRTRGQNTPMKVYSYLDSGTPLLATALPAHTQVLDDEIALLVPPEARALAEGLMRLFNDGELRNRLAAGAKARVRERYTQAVFRRKLLQFYELVEDRAPGRPAEASR